MVKVGINGFGRIGRLVFRAAAENDNIEVETGFEENLTYRDSIFITLLEKKLYKSDKGKGNPF